MLHLEAGRVIGERPQSPSAKTSGTTGQMSPMARGRRSGKVLLMNDQMLQSMRELHSRIADGIHVRLLWCERDDRIAVAVDDTKTGEAFAVEVRAGDNALDAFHHPFSYAAWRGVDTGAPLLVA